MKRTRKWAYVQQEAQRLADIGLNANQIAKRLQLNKSTVSRWLKAGKLTKGDGSRKAVVGIHAEQKQTPAEWAAAVRGEFALDASDDQLVTLAEESLALSRDPRCSVRERMAAGNEFRSTLKQLNLPAKAADAVAAKPQPDAVEPPKPKPRLVHRVKVDPRAKFMPAVNG